MGEIRQPVVEKLQRILARDGWTLERGHVAGRGRHRLQFFADQAQHTPHLAVVIAPTAAAMNRLRDASRTRALFTSLPELETVAAAHDRRRRMNSAHAGPLPIGSFIAEILANQPVGGSSASHHLLKFRAPKLGDVWPAQFVMMDTAPVSGKAGTYLKRPFGIYRVHYRHFESDWLKNLELPPTLALALHPPAPDHFDLLYKVLPEGRGTPLMTRLKRGDKVHMLGPLGRPFDVRLLRRDGIREVHVIGGGVGMAPLISLVQALRFWSFPVKVFVGIATLESLRYRDELAATFGEKPRDALIYIDDLLAAGVPPRDIFVSCDHGMPKNVRRIPKTNLFHGMVPHQYQQFLRRDTRRTPAAGVIAVTCGPNRMMEVMTGICQQDGIPLKVLMEKRMGCGFGVCLSCVCRVRNDDGEETYARVCTEGPVFDGSEILWKDDSKPGSASCGCAARC